MAWHQMHLTQTLPALAGTTSGVGGATSQIATLMGDLLSVQQGQHSDAQAACTATSQSMTMSKFFNAHLAEKLLFLSDIASAHDLPDDWIELATGNSKCEHETIETQVCVVALVLGDSDVPSFIAPDASNKIVGACLAGNKLDNFTNGVNPFLMGV